MNQTLLKLIKLMNQEINFKGIYTATTSYDTFTKQTITIHRIEQCNCITDTKCLSVLEDTNAEKLIKHLQQHMAEQLTFKNYDSLYPNSVVSYDA